MMFSQHLLIAVGISTTGPDCEREEITELAAKFVLPSCLEDETFETPLQFHTFVTSDNQPDAQNIKNQENSNTGPNFEIAFNNFLDWMQFVIREARRKSDVYLITALVGHFASWEIFPHLLRHIENNSVKDLDDRIGLWCQLADSGEFFCNLKKMGLWEKNVKTTLNDIYKHLFDQNIPDNTAIHTAEALAKIFEFSAVRQQLKNLNLLTYKAFKVWYEREKFTRRYFDDLMNRLGPDLVYIYTLQMMAYKKLSFHDIQNIFWCSRNDVVFRMNLKIKLSLDLNPEDATELFKGCKAVTKSCDCCLSFFNRKVWKRRENEI